MKKGRFYFAKYTALFILLAFYFFVVYNMTRELGFFHVFFQDKEIVGRCNIVWSLLYCVVYAIMLRFFEALMIGHRRIMDLCFGHFITSCIMNIIMVTCIWVIQPMGKGLEILVFVGFVFVQSCSGLFWIMVVHRVYERYHFVKEALFIYGNRENLKEYHRMKSTIVRYFKVNQEVDFAVGRDKLFELTDNAGIVFLGDIPTQLRNELLKYCMHTQKECYCMPKISDIYIQTAKVRQLHDKLLLQFPMIGVQGVARYVKRITDIVISLIMLLLLSPVITVIAICIKLEDGGSVFYTQERLTEGGREFDMLKFRSMKENAEKHGITLAKKDDDRVTRVGKIIRNLHLDEVPQLINVLKGDMSVVGPRPERRQFIEEYEEIIPEFSERLKVKGGLTGYAQVYGKYNTEPEDKIKYDLYYIYNYSLWLDLKILLLTIRILFQPEHIQGIEEEQTSAVKKK